MGVQRCHDLLLGDLDGFGELQGRGHCPDGWAQEGGWGIPLQADLLAGIGHLAGLRGRRALLLARVQHLSGILHFPFDPEPSIFLQKLFPGILDSQLEPGIREANLLPGIKSLLEGGSAGWLAEEALLDPDTRSNTSDSWSGVETPLRRSPALPDELVQGDVRHLALPSEPQKA